MCDSGKVGGEKSHLSTRAAELAEVLYLQDRLDESEQFTRVSEALAAADDVESQAMWRGTRAKVFARQGRVRRGEAARGREAASRVDSTDSPFLLGLVYSHVGEVARLCHDVPGAASAYEKALFFHEQKGSQPLADEMRSLLESVT